MNVWGDCVGCAIVDKMCSDDLYRHATSASPFTHNTHRLHDQSHKTVNDLQVRSTRSCSRCTTENLSLPQEVDAILLTSDEQASARGRPVSDCTVNIFNETGEKLVISKV